MLLKALKSNQPFLVLLIPVFALALWLNSFMSPAEFPFYAGEDMMVLYKPIAWLIGKNILASHITALLFTILLAFLILKLNIQYVFIKSRTLLPSAIFILISSGMPALHSMHPVYPAALFLILSVDRIFNSFDKEIIHSNAFDAGIFLAIGSLFYLNLVFLFPILWFGFIIIKPKVNWREYILSTLGFLLPWTGALVYYFIAERQDELWYTLHMNITAHQSFIKDNLAIQIFLAYLFLLTLLGSFFLLLQYDDKRISSRKFFKVFFWVFFISVTLIIASPAVSQEIIIIVSIPLSYLISNYFLFMKRQFWGEVFLYLLIIAIVLLQFSWQLPKIW